MVASCGRLGESGGVGGVGVGGVGVGGVGVGGGVVTSGVAGIRPGCQHSRVHQMLCHAR